MRMMTAAKLKTLKRPGRYRCDPSLYLFVKPTGTRSWVQRLVVDGVRREIGLGGYPDVTLTDAREQAAENRRTARKGGNPARAGAAGSDLQPGREADARRQPRATDETGIRRVAGHADPVRVPEPRGAAG